MTRTIRCSSLPLLFACGHALDESDLQIEQHHDASALGSAVHEAMRSVVQGLDVDVAAVALRFGVEESDLGPLVAYGRKAWREIADAYPLPETEVERWVRGPTIIEAGTGECDDVVLVGHIDLLSVVGRQARFLDWKSGRKESDYTPQIGGYAATLLLGGDVDEAIGTVVWLRSQTIETYRYTRADAEEFMSRIGEHLHPTARYSYGEHCARCPRSHSCPALTQLARRDVAIFSAADVEHLVEVATPAELVSIHRRAKVLQVFASSFDEELRRRIRRDGPLDAGDGRVLALVEENGRREIDTARAWPVLQERLDDDEMAAVVDVSVGRLDKVVATKAGKGRGAAARRELREALEAAGAIEQPMVTKLREIKKGDAR